MVDSRSQLQTSLLLFGDIANDAVQRLPRNASRALIQSEAARLRAADVDDNDSLSCTEAKEVAQSMDLLWPTENMSTLLLAVARITGLPPLRSTPHVAPSPIRWRRANVVNTNLSKEDVDVMAYPLSRRFAACDWEIYHLAMQQAEEFTGSR